MKFCTNMYLDNLYKPEFQDHARGQSHTDFFFCFYVHNTVATRGQYLALSKA